MAARALLRRPRPDPALCALFVLAMRRERGLSLGQVARRLGVGRRTVCTWERGRSPTRAVVVARVVAWARTVAGGRMLETANLHWPRDAFPALLEPAELCDGAESLSEGFPDREQVLARAALLDAAWRSACRSGKLTTLPSEWLELAFRAWGLHPGTLTGRCRAAGAVLYRRAFAVYLRRCHGWSLHAIGRLLHRSTSTVVSLLSPRVPS